MAYKALLPDWKIPLVYTKIYESIQKTADMLEEPVSRIRQIYDIIEKSAPDDDAETIYK